MDISNEELKKKPQKRFSRFYKMDENKVYQIIAEFLVVITGLFLWIALSRNLADWMGANHVESIVPAPIGLIVVLFLFIGAFRISKRGLKEYVDLTHLFGTFVSIYIIVLGSVGAVYFLYSYKRAAPTDIILMAIIFLIIIIFYNMKPD